MPTDDVEPSGFLAHATDAQRSALERIRLAGKKAALERVRRLMSDDEDEVYEWDRRLSRDERERFARLLLGAMGVAEERDRE